MEIWDVYDEYGNPTGETMTRDSAKVREKGIYHLGVDVWIINSDNNILIQRRSPKKRFRPNVWAMTGGSVQHGETSLEALKREVQEELQVALNVDEAQKIKRYKTDNIWLDVYFVRQDIDLSTIILQEEEVSEVKYASYEEIKTLVQNNEFIDERWEFVDEELAEFLEMELLKDER